MKAEKDPEDEENVVRDPSEVQPSMRTAAPDEL